MLPEEIIFITFAFSIAGSFFYIRGIIKGETKPNLVSWFIWMLAPFIGVFLQIKAGAGWSVLPVFLAGFMPFLILIFAIFVRNAFWKVGSLDVACGILSIMALFLWILTQQTGLAILFAILSDALAGVPTIVKSWKFPETEKPGPYLAGLVNNTLGLLIIRRWTFPIYSFGIYLILLNLIILFTIYRKRLANLFARIV